jgi:copper homeostasis protein CutC
MSINLLNINNFIYFLGTIKFVSKNLNTDISCMIRPRGGNFVYNEKEI